MSGLFCVESSIADVTQLMLKDQNILSLESKTGDSLFVKISKAGILIEKHLLLDKKPLLWTESPPYSLVGIVWSNNSLDTLVESKNKWQNNLRGDELIFPTLDAYSHRSWVIGHPRAVIKWASVVYNFENLEHQTWPQHDGHPDTKPTSRLVWLAHRIGLKVYGSN